MNLFSIHVNALKLIGKLVFIFYFKQLQGQWQLSGYVTTKNDGSDFINNSVWSDQQFKLKIGLKIVIFLAPFPV